MIAARDFQSLTRVRSLMEFQYARYVGENKYDFDMQPSEWDMAIRVALFSELSIRTCRCANRKDDLKESADGQSVSKMSPLGPPALSASAR
jgi:hypothetical protein